MQKRLLLEFLQSVMQSYFHYLTRHLILQLFLKVESVDKKHHPDKLHDLEDDERLEDLAVLADVVTKDAGEGGGHEGVGQDRSRRPERIDGASTEDTPAGLARGG